MELAKMEENSNAEGIICGHDYDATHPGVVTAVNRIFGSDKIEVRNCRCHLPPIWIKYL